MRHRVRFAPEARDDLLALYDYLADAAGAARAMAYLARIERACLGLADFPLRGAPRPDVRPHLRVMGFERRGLIAYAVGDGDVTILRVLHGGRDARGALETPGLE